jgi:MSHA biogenesis protein MshP
MGLATALFVITIMGLLAVLILQLVRNNAETTQEEIKLIRAFYAAQTGAEYGLNRAFPPDGSPSACPAVNNTASTFPLATLDVDGLYRCSFAVECSTLIVDSANYYTIRSTGTCDDVSRTVQVRAR